LADIDRDGDLDLFIGNSDGETRLFTNTASSGDTAKAYSAPITNPFGLTAFNSSAIPTLADIDRDGDLDLVIGNSAGNTLLFTNTAATPVAPVAATSPNGSYGIGSVITITVGFSENVIVTGSPRLLLATGSTDQYATYSSGTGTNTLSFQYTVQAGDSSADLDQHSPNALTLNGGTIKDAAGNNAILTLAAPAATGSLAANAQLVINGAPPTVSATSSTATLVEAGGSAGVASASITLSKSDANRSVIDLDNLGN